MKDFNTEQEADLWIAKFTRDFGDKWIVLKEENENSHQTIGREII